MKKRYTRFLAGLLALCLLWPGALPSRSRAFSDIPQVSQSLAAESLQSLGILADSPTFQPGSSLTRAQFCKMAVLAAGFEGEAAYQGYTIYPDVPAGSWYAPYVYGAVKKYKIIQGYPDGRFGPEDPITYGQAVTILLRLLGYSGEDLGAFWPRDALAKGEQVGLCRTLSGLSPNGPIPRGQAAILLYNLLTLPTKEGGSFLSQGFAPGEGQMLYARDKEGKESLFSLSGEAQRLPAPLPENLLGTMGTPVGDKSQSGKIKGFLPAALSFREETVKKAGMNKLEITSGSLPVGKEVKIFSLGQMAEYQQGFLDLREGARVRLYFDSRGDLQLIYEMTQETENDTFVYGASDRALPQNAKLLLGGHAMPFDKLEKYDVLTYSPEEGGYLVSRDRRLVLLEEAGPIYSAPERIRAGGKEYTVPQSAAGFFEKVQVGQLVLLCFDTRGQVAGAFPQGAAAPNTVALLHSLSKEGKATLRLPSGETWEGDATFDGYPQIIANQEIVSSLFREEGRLVQVTQNSRGQLVLRHLDYKTALAGELRKSQGTLGERKMARNAAIYEQPAPGMPLRPITWESLPETLPKNRVIHAREDAAGCIDLLVLDNVTGDGFLYGLVSQYKSEKVIIPGEGPDYDEQGKPIPGTGSSDLTRTVYTLRLRTKDGTREITSFYSGGDMGSTPVPGAVAVALTPAAEDGEGRLTVAFSTPGKRLQKAATVSEDKFDSRLGVRIGDVYVPISENVQIYAPKLDRFLTLQEARMNFKQFDLYCDTNPLQGGRVRIIIVK